MSESQFAIVSDWMANGNINEFLRGNPDVNRVELVCLSSEFLPRFERTDEQIGDPAKGRCHRADLYSSTGNDPRGSQRCTFFYAESRFPVLPSSARVTY